MPLLNIFSKEDSGAKKNEYDKKRIKATGKYSEKKSIEEANNHADKNESLKSKVDFSILVRPIITEKSTDLNKINKYVFEIKRRANKLEVKKAIKDIYGIMPISIRIVGMKGKQVGKRQRITGKRKDWKKAIVTVRDGESINVYQTEKNE